MFSSSQKDWPLGASSSPGSWAAKFTTAAAKGSSLTIRSQRGSIDSSISNTAQSWVSSKEEMESTSNRPSPFVPASQVPLHRNPPLAPSQELAYREKCIALRRRLTEIETNNDNLRKRLEREKRFQDKMRLNRAILLNHLKEMMDSPDTKLSRQDLENLGVGLRGNGNLAEHLGYDLSETPGMRGPARSEYIMDDSSAESDEEIETEVRYGCCPFPSSLHS
jgi:hypothetical protein